MFNSIKNGHSAQRKQTKKTDKPRHISCLVGGGWNQQPRGEGARQNREAACVSVGEGAAKPSRDAAHIGLACVHRQEHHPQKGPGVPRGILFEEKARTN